MIILPVFSSALFSLIIHSSASIINQRCSAFSDLNLRPLSTDKPQGTEHQPEELVGDDAHPDSVNAKVQHVTADVGYDRTDEGDADAGADHRVNHVACAAQAASENDLADLEQDDDRDRAGDADTDCDDLLFPEEQTVERPAK